jgi:hypothetical protein
MTVRRLAPGEVDLLRDIRLRALRDAPLAFSSSYAREAAFEPAEWERRARENAAATALYAGAGFVDTGERDPLGHCDAVVAVLERALP